MKTIKFNNYLLPNVGARLKGEPEPEVSEFLRLIKKASRHDQIHRGDVAAGVPLDYMDDPYNWYWTFPPYEKFEYLPLPLATTWLKVALGEITRENWVVDIEAEKDHEKLHEFRMWLNRKRNFSFIFNDRFYGVVNGLPRSVNAEDRPDVINLDMFFTYFYEQEAELLPDPAEPVKGSLVQWSDNGKFWHELPRIYTGAKTQEGNFITEGVGANVMPLWASKHIRLATSPEKLAREQAETKAKDWLESSKFISSYSSIQVLTEYILKEKM